MRPGSLRAGTVGPLDLPCVLEFGAGNIVLGETLVVHPLWRLDIGGHQRFVGRSSDPRVRFVDTFQLERRPLRALEMSQDRKPAPESRLADIAEAV
jgi:hypothetical protein